MTTVSNLKLHDIASRAVLTVSPDASLEEVIGRFAEKHVSSLIVIEDERPLGIITERDLVRLMCLAPVERQSVRSVMSAPLMTVPHDLDFSSAQAMMVNCGIRHLVLVDEAGHLWGVVSETDFRRHLGTDLLALIQSLNTVVDQGGKLMAPEATLASALETMASCRLDYVIVGAAGHAEGILTERDIPALLARRIDPQQITLAEVMTCPLATIRIGASIDEAARHLEQSGLRHLVVLDDQGIFIGVLSQHRMLEKLGVALMGQSRAQLEDLMSMVLEATGVGTWDFDNVRRKLVRSEALDKMLAAQTGQVIDSLEGLLKDADPEDRQRLVASFTQLLLGRVEKFSVDCRIPQSDQLSRWISLRGKVLERDHEGRALRSAGVAIDISAQKASEELLRKSEARFRGLMERIPLALGHVNAQEEILFTNAHFTALFGYEHAEVPNLTQWWARAYPDEKYRAWVRASWAEAVHHAAETGAPLPPQEYRITRKDGQVRRIEISGIALGEDFLAIFIDVTEQREQQALLEFSNAILQRISVESRLVDILDAIVRGIQSEVAGLLCSILLLDDSGQHLIHGSAPDLPGDYLAAIDGIAIGSQVGSCGMAAYEGREIFTADIANDPRWANYKHLAQAHGLVACWSSPIFSTAGKVLGTFAVYWREAQPDVSSIRRYVEAAMRLAAIAIENAQRDGELRKRIEELRRWQQATLGREGRVIELKREVNALLARLGEAPRYGSVTDDGAGK